MDRLRVGLRELVGSLPRDARLSAIAYEAIGSGVYLALDEALTLALRALGPVTGGGARRPS